MNDNFFFDHKRHFFLHNHRDLNLNSFNFSLVNLDSLVLNSVSIGLDRNLFNYFYRDSLLDLNLYKFLFDYSSFNNSRNLNFLNLFFFNYHNLLHRNFNLHLYFLDYDLRNWNFHNLKFNFLANNNLLDYLRYLYDLFDDSRNDNDLLHYLLNFNNPRNFHNLLDDSINELRLHFYYFSFDYDRNWFVDFDWFHNFLLGSNNFYILNFYFFNLFTKVGLRNSFYDRYLFSDVERYDLLDLNLFSSQNFLNNRLIYKYLDFSNDFLSISFYEMRTININFFGYFFDDLLFHL